MISRRVYDGLTLPQHRVACLVADGFHNKSIAAKLGVTVHCVNKHLKDIAVAWELDPCRHYRVQITHRVLARKPEPDPLQIPLAVAS